MKKGRKSHEPNEQTRATVTSYASVGETHCNIAKIMGINKETLVKYYRTELETALIQKNRNVALNLYKKAIEGNVAAMIFWLKTRGGWKEVTVQQSQELDAEGNPIDKKAQIITVTDYEVRSRMERIENDV